MENRYSRSARGLIEAAEQLFARDGLAVPLTDIGQAAGSANKVAVQYHFGDRQRLIEAVFKHRLPQLEARRAALIETLEIGGEPSTDRLLEALLAPIAEIVDANGRLSFAGFLYQLTANDRAARAAFDPLAPVARRIVDLLRVSLPELSSDVFQRRLGTAALVFLDTLVRLDACGTAASGKHEALALSLAVLTGGRRG